MVKAEVFLSHDSYLGCLTQQLRAEWNCTCCLFFGGQGKLRSKIFKVSEVSFSDGWNFPPVNFGVIVVIPRIPIVTNTEKQHEIKHPFPKATVASTKCYQVNLRKFCAVFALSRGTLGCTCVATITKQRLKHLIGCWRILSNQNSGFHSHQKPIAPSDKRKRIKNLAQTGETLVAFYYGSFGES